MTIKSMTEKSLILEGVGENPALDLNLQTHSVALDLESKFDSSSNFKAGVLKISKEFSRSCNWS